jgi:hypothetical protein
MIVTRTELLALSQDGYLIDAPLGDATEMGIPARVSSFVLKERAWAGNIPSPNRTTRIRAHSMGPTGIMDRYPCMAGYEMPPGEIAWFSTGIQTYLPGNFRMRFVPAMELQAYGLFYIGTSEVAHIDPHSGVSLPFQNTNQRYALSLLPGDLLGYLEVHKTI